MIKILQIYEDQSIGGIGTVIKNITNCMSSYEISIKNYKVKQLPLYRVLKCINQVYIIRKEISKFDIVHIHGFRPVYLLYFTFKNIKMVYHLHGLLGTGRKLRKYEKIKEFLNKQFIKGYCDVVIAVSEYAKNKIIKEYEIDSNKVLIIHNSSDFKICNPKEWNKNHLNICYHGRFVKFKRIDRLLKVAKLVSNYTKVKVVLIGTGNKNELIELSKSFNLDLKFVDYVNNPQDILKEFDCSILPSNNEYFGISGIEAILTGLPLFMFSDGGGCLEIYDANYYEYFVAKDEIDMSNKIINYFNGAESIEFNSKFSELQNNIRKRFSNEEFGRKLFETYQKLGTKINN